LAAAFFATLFAMAGCCVCLADLIAAQRRLVASMILFLPAALSFRFGSGASRVADADGDADCLFDSAQRFRWASPIRFRAAALIFRFRFCGSVAVPGPVRPTASICRISAIWASIRPFLGFKTFDSGGEYFRVELLSWHMKLSMAQSGRATIPAESLLIIP
jgi:hypothetical protein